jgi:hypothetical protein
MSVEIPVCADCNAPLVFERAARFPSEVREAERLSYGVGWRCEECERVTMELCPVGPVEPSPGRDRCLSCGARMREDSARGDWTCSDCRMSASEACRFLGVAGMPCTLELAEAAFARGLHRHAFAMLDVVLREDPRNIAAWRAKADAYERLGLVEAVERCRRRAGSERPLR